MPLDTSSNTMELGQVKTVSVSDVIYYIFNDLLNQIIIVVLNVTMTTYPIQEKSTYGHGRFLS